MKVTIAKQDLRDAVARVMPAVAVKPSTPVTSGIYLQTAGDRLKIRATNFTQDISLTIPAHVETEGAACVVGKWLGQIVGKLGGEIVTLHEENSKLKVKSEAASYELHTFDAGDFPSEQNIDWDYSVRFRTDEFRELLKSVIFCVSKDECRPVFTGVNLTQAGISVTALATNTHRIARRKIQAFDPIDEERSVIIPAATCYALINSLTSSITEMSVSKNRAQFAFENEKLTTALIDGTFPPTDKLFKSEWDKRAEGDVAELLAALDRVGVIALNTEDTSAKMTFTQDGLELSAKSNDIGEAVEHIDIALEGGNLAIAFNIRYLLNVFKALGSNRFVIEMDGDLKPTLIRGVGNDDCDYLVTPLRTRG